MEPHASLLVSVGIAAIACILALVGAFAYAHAGKAAGETGAQRTRRFFMGLLAIGAWMTVTALVARSGVLTDFSRRPPPMMFIILGTAAVGLTVGLSPVGRRLASGLPFAALFGIQSFRLPLELVMHRAATEGVMPMQMSFSGYNFDIVAGVLSAIVAVTALKKRPPLPLLMLANLIGAALLMTIAIIGVTSLPNTAAFGTAPEKLSTWLTYFPYVWLPAVMVATAMAVHLVVARKIAAVRRAGRA